MLTLNINRQTFRQIDELTADTRAAIADLKDRKDVLKIIKTKQNRRWRDNFRSEGASYGRWQPLRPATVARRGGSAHPILIQSGRMLGWVHAQNRAAVVTADAVLWNIHGDGSGGSYAVFHQTGSFNVPWTNWTGRFTFNPARKIWDIDAIDEARAEREMSAFVDRILAEHFS